MSTVLQMAKDKQFLEGSCQNIWNDRLCGSLDLDRDMFDQFEEFVCKRCKAYCKDYELINRRQLQDEYLITDDSVGLMLFVNKPNPRNSHWSAMKMYLRKHGIEKAMKRFGTEKVLEEEIRKRKSEQFKRDLKKTDGLLSSKRDIESMEEREKEEKDNSKDISKKKQKQNKTVKKMSGLIASIRGTS